MHPHSPACSCTSISANLARKCTDDPWKARRAELRREARHYAADPAPVTRGAVRLSPPWLDAAWRGQIGDGAAASADEERIRVEASWGRWLWLVAELVPNGVLLTSSCFKYDLVLSPRPPVALAVAACRPGARHFVAKFDLVRACIALLCQ